MNTCDYSGAVYVFSRIDDRWYQQAFLKASNADRTDFFGASVALSGNGNTLVVGAFREANCNRPASTPQDNGCLGLNSRSDACSCRGRECSQGSEGIRRSRRGLPAFPASGTAPRGAMQSRSWSSHAAATQSSVAAGIR